ncbi:MAG: methyl-accepting chemotaxis protein [Bdellovibrionales bacterium]|nr:methyl-accepting chemotaxis protein [Bdellovibrionales bacterium]
MSMQMKPVLRKVPEAPVVATEAPKRRHSYWINPRFQWSMIGWMWVCAGVVISVFYAGIRYFFYKFEKLAMMAGLPPEHDVFQFFIEQQDQMNRIFFGTSMGALIFLTLLGLILSHRVAGPVLRIQKHLDKLADGKTMEDVQFREKDYFPELAGSVNAFAAKYKKLARKATARRFIS